MEAFISLSAGKRSNLISIKRAVSELEQCQQLRRAAQDGLGSAVAGVRKYVLEVDPELARKHRQRLGEVSQLLARADSATVFEQADCALHSALREYHARAAEYLSRLHKQLSDSTRALETVLGSMTVDGDDNDKRMREQLNRFGSVARQIQDPVARGLVEAVRAELEICINELRRQHQATVSQMMVEIRMLHSRIQGLQSTPGESGGAEVCCRYEFESRIEGLLTDSHPFSLLALTLLNMSYLTAQHGPEICAALKSEFSKRINGRLEPGAAVTQWRDDVFLVMLTDSKRETVMVARDLSKTATGQYEIPVNGARRKLVLSIGSGVVECSGLESLEKVLDRVSKLVDRVAPQTA